MRNYPRGDAHPRVKYPDELVERARRLHDAGEAPQRIAEALGVPKTTLKDWLQYRTRHQTHTDEPLRRRRYVDPPKTP